MRLVSSDLTRALHVICADSSPISGFIGHNRGKSIWVNAGLFPPGTVPAPQDELFIGNHEKWYKPQEGARQWEENPK